MAERLLDDHTVPAALVIIGQAVLLQLGDDHLEARRRDGQVERMVPTGSTCLVEFSDGVLQLVEGFVGIEGAGHETDALQQLLPDLFAEGGPGVLLDGVVHLLGEVLVLPVTTREANESESRRQHAAVGEVVHGGHELLA